MVLGTVAALAVVALTLTACGAGQGRGATGPVTDPIASVSFAGSAADDTGAGSSGTTTVPPVRAPTSTATPTTPPVTSAPCDVPAGGVVPSELAGYAVAPDDSGAMSLLALPPGMQAAGFVHVRRGDGAVVDVAAVAGAGYAFADLADSEVLDRFARSVGVVDEPVPVAVGGRSGVVVHTASRMTMYAWMPCRNVLEAVIGADPAMAADVAARVAG